MTRLRDLTAGISGSWDDAAARFTWPPVDAYNIAADCLSADADAPAVLVHDGTRLVSTTTFGDLDARSAAVARHLLPSSLGRRPR